MRAQKNRIVIVVTSHSELGSTGKKTGYHLEELAVPYLEFKRSGADIVIASPKGGQPPVDPKSAQKESAASQEFLNDPEASRLLRHSVKVDDVQGNIDVLFFPGGHGPMWDLADSVATTTLIEQVWRDGGVIGALCHGPAALINAKDEEGKPLVSGRKVNSYTDEEEKSGELFDVIPFHLEAKLRELGAKFENSPKKQAHMVRDGRLVTGQNPASARGVAQEILQALEMSDAEQRSGASGPNEPAPKPQSRRASPLGYSGRIGAGAHLQEPSAERIASMQEGVSTGNIDRAETPRGAEDRLPTGMTADARSEPNGLRNETIAGREERRMASPETGSPVLHDDLPRVKQQQATRTAEQEEDGSEAASLQHKDSERSDKASRSPRR